MKISCRPLADMTTQISFGLLCIQLFWKTLSEVTDLSLTFMPSGFYRLIFHTNLTNDWFIHCWLILQRKQLFHAPWIPLGSSCLQGYGDTVDPTSPLFLYLIRWLVVVFLPLLSVHFRPVISQLCLTSAVRKSSPLNLGSKNDVVSSSSGVLS